jgi:hypothetical protein
MLSKYLDHGTDDTARRRPVNGHASNPSKPWTEQRDFQQGIFAPKKQGQAHGPLAQHGCAKIPIAGVRVHNGHTLQRGQTLKINSPTNQFEQPSGPNMALHLKRIGPGN